MLVVAVDDPVAPGATLDATRVAIHVEGLSKAYRLGDESLVALQEVSLR